MIGPKTGDAYTLFEAYLRTQRAHKVSGAAGQPPVPQWVLDRLAPYTQDHVAARPLGNTRNSEAAIEH